MCEVEGKHVLVTGGTRGLGLVMARALLEHGAASLIISSRKPEACAAAQEELRAAAGAGQEVHAVPADLARPEECTRLAEEAARHTDALHVLVNNAGATWGAPIDDYPAAAWDKVLGLNVTSPFLLTQALLPLLERAATPDDPARVINIGSVDGMRVPPVPNFAYAASKAAVHHLTRVLAGELGPRGITVNAIAPGLFETAMTRGTLATHRESFEASSALGRIGRPEDLAGVVVFLASRGSAYVTGSVLAVDGGTATTV